MMMFNKTHLGVIFALISAILFASKAIFVKQAYAVSPDVTAMNLLVLRMLTALPFYLAILYFLPKMTETLKAKDWGLLVITGLLGYYASSVLDFMGLLYISASLERIVLFLYPTIIVVASAILYGQKVAFSTWLAILLSYLGTVLVMWFEPQNNTTQHHLWLGVGLVFASAITYAMYMMMSQNLVKKFGSLRFTALATSTAIIGVLLHYIISTPTPWASLQQLPMTVYGYGLALGIFATVLPTILMMMGVERLGASRTAMIMAGGPIFTILFAVVFLDEQLNFWQWLGCALNMFGVLMVSLKKNG